MIILIGYLHMLLYVIVGVLGLVVCIVSMKDKRKKSRASRMALRALTKMPFSAITFECEKECIICWNQYTDSE